MGSGTQTPHENGEMVTRRLASAMCEEDVPALVRELLLARLAEAQLTPDERREAERLLAAIEAEQ